MVEMVVGVFGFLVEVDGADDFWDFGFVGAPEDELAEGSYADRTIVFHNEARFGDLSDLYGVGDFKDAWIVDA